MMDMLRRKERTEISYNVNMKQYSLGPFSRIVSQMFMFANGGVCVVYVCGGGGGGRGAPLYSSACSLATRPPCAI